jgi:hypothetical protein
MKLKVTVAVLIIDYFFNCLNSFLRLHGDFAIAGRDVVTIGSGTLLCHISWLDITYLAVQYILYIVF